jgi:CubicO group peptidase (beta-lactamase class C family)
MMVHDGKVFLEWGDVETNYQCHSIRKPFLGALIGLALESGQMHLDVTLGELDIDDIPPSLTAEELTATVRMLLESRSGVYHEAAGETQQMEDERPERGSHPPGTFFYYNNFDFNALGTIYRQETSDDIFEAFQQRIAGPIGMEDFDPALCSYNYELDKSEHPVYAFRMSARDMARFGVLYQQRGVWRGQRLIREQWIDESTMVHSVVDTASGLGYGYMWRVFPEGSVLAELTGYPGFYHTGLGVHALVVIPGLDLVVVQRMDTDDPSWSDPGDEATFTLIQMIFAAHTERAAATTEDTWHSSDGRSRRRS